jgi:hypothetical protein
MTANARTFPDNCKEVRFAFFLSGSNESTRKEIRKMHLCEDATVAANFS